MLELQECSTTSSPCRAGGIKPRALCMWASFLPAELYCPPPLTLDRVLPHCSDHPGSHGPLAQPPEHWGYRCTPACSAPSGCIVFSLHLQHWILGLVRLCDCLSANRKQQRKEVRREEGWTIALFFAWRAKLELMVFLKIAQIVVLPKASTLAGSRNDKLLLSKGTSNQTQSIWRTLRGEGESKD